jgi:DNA-binding SARP family transcriptional activator
MTQHRSTVRRDAALRAAANENPASVLPTSLDDGATLLRAQGLAGLRAALAGAAGPAAHDSGWTKFWRGYVAQFDDLMQARSDWLRAFELFARDDDNQGLELAACGLAQAMVLDNQADAAFDHERAPFIERIALASRPADVLDLFRLAGRLGLLAERRDASDANTVVLNQALASLALPIEPEIRLRMAVAALPILGLTLSPSQVDDFFHAAAELAQSAQVSAYGRALWHMHVVDALFYDASRDEQVNASLVAVEQLARHAALRPLQARASIMRGAQLLSRGQAAQAKTHFDAAHRLLDPARPRDYWTLHYYLSRQALMAGDAEQAWAQVLICRQKQVELSLPPERTTMVLMQEAYVQCARGQWAEAEAAFQRAGELSVGAQATPCHLHVHLTRALRRLREGALPEARAELIAGFTQARAINLTHFFRALPGLAATLCGAALDLDADTSFALSVIVARNLPCPDLGVARWPWPLRVRCFGGFSIERDGAPLRASRKAPVRLIDLLRLVAAWGGRQVDAARAAATLWPDAEGDAARDALKTLLQRARAWLGKAETVHVRDGQISFDSERVWLDTWAFEHVCSRIDACVAASGATSAAGDGELARRSLQLHGLYRGHFLGDGDLPAWALPQRDRLRARYVRCAELLGARLENLGRLDDAIALYRTALEHDNLAEELYQRLIGCHLARGEAAQALNAYRRCRELLSVVLGLRPSARTEALAARIAGR